MAKDNTLFDALNAINEKKKFEKKLPSGYIISLWLSQSNELIERVNKINPYIFSLDDKLTFKYFMKSVPQKKRYIRWTKKTTISKSDQKKIDELCHQYKISEREAKLSLGL